MGQRLLLVGLFVISGISGLAIASDELGETELPRIDVDSNQQEQKVYSDLTKKLQPSPNPAANPDAPGNQQMGSEAIINRPGNKLDLYNNAATGHRMGNTFGTSVHPQRPAKTSPTSPFPQNK